MSSLLRAYKHDGWHVTYLSNERGLDVFRHCPWIDKLVLQRTNQVPVASLSAFWSGLATEYDKFVNLSGSMEVELLATPDSTLWKMDDQARRAKVGHLNYSDYLMAKGGYPDRVGERPQLHFSQAEQSQARAYRKKYRGKFLILWALSGSSFHKTYPEAANVATMFLESHPEAMTLTVGGKYEQVLEWAHPRAKSYSGIWPVRKSLLMADYADVIVTPETAMAWAAACTETPTLLILSHSSVQNLCHYWPNVVPLMALDAPCYPCHKLHYDRETCPQSPRQVPVCVEGITPELLLNSLEMIYDQWEARHGVLCGHS